MTPKCIAYKEDGTICNRPATQIDNQRGGMVCTAHRSPTPPPTPAAGLTGAKTKRAPHNPPSRTQT
jgi:hypothetical protein